MRTGGPKPANVEEYFDAVAEPVGTTLNKVRAIIKSIVPKRATEGLSWGMRAFKEHCGLFPMSTALIDEMADELTAYQTSKGTLQFTISETGRGVDQEDGQGAGRTERGKN